MVKFFCRHSNDSWSFISAKLNHIVDAYEIITKEYNFNLRVQKSLEIRENAIKCYDENQEIQQEFCHMGLSDMRYWASADYEMLHYSSKIEDKINENDDVIIAIADDINGYSFYNYFRLLKKKVNCHLHVAIIINQNNRTSEDRGFLRLLPDIHNAESFVVFNLSPLLYNADEFWEHLKSNPDMELNEDIDIANRIFEDELTDIIRHTDFTKLHTDDNHIYVYSHSRQAYEKSALSSYDIIDPAIYNREIFEIIAPNEGKKTCQQLRKIRNNFRTEHHIKDKEKECTYPHHCFGTCTACDRYSEQLWNRTEPPHEKYSRQNKSFLHTTANICGVERLRFDTDGKGIRSLIIMNECNLKCEYCINQSVINQLPTVEKVTVRSLGNMLKKDAVYFEMTGGGVTFGGGEPLLYPEFIRDFHTAYPMWHIVVQTSLNVDNSAVKMLTEAVDEWIIDIKDINPTVYRAYTGKDNQQVLDNLIFLLKYIPSEKIVCRVPHIPNYNTESDIQYSIQKLRETGVQRIDEFPYAVHQRKTDT